MQSASKCWSTSISIHALRGEGDIISRRWLDGVKQISIHALRGEGDSSAIIPASRKPSFQSTPSVGRATPAPSKTTWAMIISIHALRGEGDLEQKSKEAIKTNISIHALRGEGDCWRICR